MVNIAHDLTGLIGKTPMLRLTRFARHRSLRAELLAKLEFFNPAGSVKDRVALAMIEEAEANGCLKTGGVIIEPTSGNTGIGLALVAAVKGYSLILTMPDSMSEERRRLLAAYGARLVLTDGTKGMIGAIEKARELADTIPDSFIPGQFSNPSNPEAHFKTTGPEIWQDTGGRIDALVAGVGSGGTLTGAGGFLKGKIPSLKIIAVEPADSSVLSGGAAGAHELQGIGAGFVPEVYDAKLCDEIITVRSGDAYMTARELASTEGLLAGISAGAAVWAASELAARPDYAGKTIAVIIPDTGERYLSTPLYAGQ